MGTATNQTDRLRPAISEVADALRGLHRELMRVARTQYEDTVREIPTAGEMLRLLMNEPSFAWLRVLSALMADIDELLAGQTISEMDAAAVRTEVAKLVSPPQLDMTEFYEKYRAALQTPEVTMAHARLRDTVKKLPEPEPEDIAEILRVRHKWAERNRRKLR